MNNLKALSLENLANLKKQQTLSPVELESMQRDNLIQLVQYARTNNPFYRSFLPDLAKLPDQTNLAELLQQLPIMNRSLIQQNYSKMKIIKPGTLEKDYGVSKTSGSTGQPVEIFKYSLEYRSVIYGISLLEWEWHNRDLAKPLAMFRIGAESDGDFVIQEPINYLGEVALGSQYRSDNRPIPELIDALLRHKPSYLFVNAITARLMAKEVLLGSYPKITIEQILSVSDPIDTNFRELMREAFSAKVVDRYSTEELGLFALQCAHADHLHIVAPHYLVELLDEANEPVPHGEPGRVVVTFFASSAMPLIRYELGDLAAAGDDCPSGITWPVLSQITGRVRDYVDYPDGSRNIATFVYSKILSLPDLYDFQAVLFSDTVLLVCGVTDPLSEASQQVIHAELSRIFGEQLRTEIRQTGQLPILKPAKRPEFIRISGPFWEAADLSEYLDPPAEPIS